MGAAGSSDQVFPELDGGLQPPNPLHGLATWARPPDLLPVAVEAAQAAGHRDEAERLVAEAEAGVRDRHGSPMHVFGSIATRPREGPPSRALRIARAMSAGSWDRSGGMPPVKAADPLVDPPVLKGRS
jgi:hypothetical protein